MARRRKSRPRSALRAPRSTKPFWGDQVLAAYHGIGCCVLAGFCFLLTGVWGASIVNSPEPSLYLLKDPTPAFPFLALLVVCVLAVTGFFLCRGIWRGRKWAMWLDLLLHLPGIASIYWDWRAVFSAVVPLYLILRLAGGIGPKLR